MIKSHFKMCTFAAVKSISQTLVKSITIGSSWLSLASRSFDLGFAEVNLVRMTSTEGKNKALSGLTRT